MITNRPRKERTSNNCQSSSNDYKHNNQFFPIKEIDEKLGDNNYINIGTVEGSNKPKLELLVEKSHSNICSFSNCQTISFDNDYHFVNTNNYEMSSIPSINNQIRSSSDCNSASQQSSSSTFSINSEFSQWSQLSDRTEFGQIYQNQNIRTNEMEDINRNTVEIRHSTSIIQDTNNPSSSNSIINDQMSKATANNPRQQSLRAHIRNPDESSPILIDDIQSTLESVDPESLPLLLLKEQQYQPNPNYSIYQTGINAHSMRAILFDWMCEVSEEFALSRETFWLSINYVDRFLTLNIPPEFNSVEMMNFHDSSLMEYFQINPIQKNDSNRMDYYHIDRSNFQLLGITCLFIASKVEETHPPAACDFINTTDSAFTLIQMYHMERIILRRLDWKLYSPTPFSWIKLLIKLCVKLIYTRLSEEMNKHILKNPDCAIIQGHQSNNANYDQPSSINEKTCNTCTQLGLLLEEEILDFLSVETFVMCMQFVDQTIFDSRFLSFFPSAIATSALLLLHSNVEHRVETICSVSGYDFEILKPCILAMREYSTMPWRGTKITRINQEMYRKRVFGYLTRKQFETMFKDVKSIDAGHTRQVYYTEGLKTYKELQKEPS